MTVKGVPSHTISQGKVVWADGRLEAVRGAGRYIDRPTFPPVFAALALQNRLKAHRPVVRRAAE